MHDFNVTVGNTLDHRMTTCGFFSGVAVDAQEIPISCNTSLPGRYVRIELSGTSEILTLCEVEVFGNLLNFTSASEGIRVVYNKHGLSHSDHQ